MEFFPYLHLQIKQIVDLPVGENLQDHIKSEANTYLIDKPWSMNERKSSSIWENLKYLIYGEGELSKYFNKETRICYNDIIIILILVIIYNTAYINYLQKRKTYIAF